MFLRNRGRLTAIFLVLATCFVSGSVSASWADGLDSNVVASSAAIGTDTAPAGDVPPADQPAGGADTPVEADTYADVPSTSGDNADGSTTTPIPSVTEPRTDPSSQQQSPPPKDDASSASSEADAALIATQHGHNVVVDSLTTETTQVEALPDGTFQMTSSSTPVRINRDGDWVNIDPTLGSADAGYFSPAATAVPVRFSDGGTGPIAQVQLPSGEWFSESWELGPLPTPSVDGATAIYAEVIPAVDLQLTATSTGMTEVVVVKTAEAAADPRLMTLKLKVDGAALATADDGSTVAAPVGVIPSARTRAATAQVASVDPESMLRSGQPKFWDSSDPTSGPAGPGGNTIAAPVDSIVTGGTTVTVDVASISQQAGITYPLYIDPDWGTGNIHAWSINHTYPDTHYLDLPDNSDGRGNQIVGYLPAGWTAPYPGDGLAQWGRSFWEMSTAIAPGKHILHAQFKALQTWNSTCDMTEVRLFNATSIPSAGASWNESAGVVYNGPSDVKATNNGSNCAGPSWIGFDATQSVLSNGNGAEIILALAASDESSGAPTWKRFNRDAQLVITYNTAPSTPSNPVMSSPPRACGTLSNPAYINPTLDFTVAATLSDPDTGQNVWGRFRVVPYNNGSINAIPGAAPLGYLDSGSQPSGSLHTMKILANSITQDGTYAWTVSAWDTYDNWNSTTKGHDSSTEVLCFFVAKRTTPSLPSVTFTQANPSLMVGHGVGVTFTSPVSDKVAGYEYWYSYTAATTFTDLPVPVGVDGSLPPTGTVTGATHIVSANSAGVATATVAPPDVTSTLWVASFDRAGNVSKDGSNVAANLPMEVHKLDGTTIVPQPDVTSVSFTGQGHGWRTATWDDFGNIQTVGPPFSSSFPDSNGSSSGTQLSIMTGFPLSATSKLPVTDTAIPVFKDYGGVALDRVYSSSVPDHAAVSAGQIPAGYVVEDQLGQMAPLTRSGAIVVSGTVPLYECRQSNGNNFTSRSSTCEGSGASPTLLGGIWPPPATGQQPVYPPNPDLPTTRPWVSLYRCSVGNDHFDISSHTAGWSNCSGYGTPSLIGYLVDLGSMQTVAPPIDTHNSFTVSAWVNPAQESDLSTYNTIVSQQGNADSAFVLQERPGSQTNPNAIERHFRFCIRTQVASPKTDCAEQATVVSPNSWTFVTGIWDSVNQQLRLNVNASAQPVAYTGHIVPAGETLGGHPLSIGSGFSNSCRVNMWRGMIANVTIFPGVASSTQLSHLYSLFDPNAS